MGKKILVVDDDENFLRFISFNLREAGYETITASNGVDGFNKAVNENPDIILLDIMMPFEDGYSTLVKLKKSHKTKTIPVIMITAKNKVQDICEAQGTEGYIVKPVTFNVVQEKIKKVLKEE